jgi:hypothetical protein
MECASCISDLDHCHGTLVVHPDGLVECTELACVELDRARHLSIIDCQQVDGGCQCTESVDLRSLRQAS